MNIFVSLFSRGMHLCMHVCICVHACLCLHALGTRMVECMCVYVCPCMWRPEGMLGIFLDHFSMLFIEAESCNLIQGLPSGVVSLASFL